MKPAQLAINSISTSHPNMEGVLDAYAEAGFKNVEFYLPQVKAVGAAQVRQMLEARGLCCVGGFEGVLNAFSNASNSPLVENARLLAELGGTILVHGTDGPPKDGPTESEADPLGTIAHRLGEVARDIEATGVTLCTEFNWSPLVKSLRSAVEVCERSGASNVGVLFDPAHYHCTPTKFEQINARSVLWIKHVHVDNMADKPGELSQCNADRVLPDDPAGCLDLRALYGALEAHGYRGYFSIEMFSDELWQLSPREAAARMYRSLLPLCD